MKKIALIFISFLVITLAVHAGQEGIACRSVHLAYKAPAGTRFYNELKVEESADGTYFMACGFSVGYFGIQELHNGKKVVIFSVWDPTKGNNPNAVAEDKRVKVLHNGEGVRVSRFGGEGTGGKSMWDYDWKKGETYRFMVDAEVDGEWTTFSGFFYVPEKKEWKHLVSFKTLTGGKLLKGYYSFIEDFRRNRTSTKKVRRASYGNGWVRDKEGKWHELTTARFTADNTQVMNIDAGVKDDHFFLATGGETKNENAKLWKHITRQAEKRKPPEDLPTARKPVKNE